MKYLSENSRKVIAIIGNHNLSKLNEKIIKAMRIVVLEKNLNDLCNTSAVGIVESSLQWVDDEAYINDIQVRSNDYLINNLVNTNEFMDLIYDLIKKTDEFKELQKDIDEVFESEKILASIYRKELETNKVSSKHFNAECLVGNLTAELCEDLTFNKE